MSLVTASLNAGEAQRLTQRIRLTAGSIRDNMVHLNDLVAEAKAGSAHVVLGFASWTAYLADTLGEEPLRLNREERQEVVAMLAGEGMSTRAIAPIVGASQRTVADDVSKIAHLPSAEVPVSDTHHEFPTEPEWSPDEGFVDESTGEVMEAAPEAESPAPVDPKTITGLDGKSYTAPSTPREPRRTPLTDTARNVGYDARKIAERIQRLAADDRFTRNKDEVASLIRGHLMFTVEVCQDLLDTFNQSQEN